MAEGHGIRVELPAGWTTQPPPEGVDLVARGPVRRGPAPVLSVSTAPPPPTAERERWLASRFTHMATLLTDLRLIDYTETTLGADEVPALWMTASYRQGVFVFTTDLWAVFWPDRAALVSFVCESLQQPDLIAEVRAALARSAPVEGASA